MRFDGRLVDHRPDLDDSAGLESIEDVFVESDSPTIDRDAHEPARGRHVEAQTAGDMRWLRHHERDVEPQVGDVANVALEHRAVAWQADALAVVSHVVMHVSTEFGPCTPIEAVDVRAIEVAKRVGFTHEHDADGNIDRA